MNQQAPLRFHPRLVEEAVFLALREHPQSGAFYSERNRLYQIADADKREQAFLELNRAWYLRLGLARPIEQALDEQPLIASHVRLYAVGCAAGKKEEGVELFVSSDEGLGEKERRTVQILLRPESLLDPAALLPFLRHELFHIADMLDPQFGYEPTLPPAEGGPTHDRLLKERYRALWDTIIDGRMARRGWASESAHSERLRDFTRVFPVSGETTAQVFGHFFDQDNHTHAEIAAFALAPRAAFQKPGASSLAGSRCPLCGFPTYDFEPEPESLPKQVAAAIEDDFPAWRPADGLCKQCAELYRAREMSLLAARELPRAG
jgi:hypothetical protein